MTTTPPSVLEKLSAFCLDNKFIVALLIGFIILWGLVTAPFDWKIGGLTRDPVPVDAIPDIGENQQIVFTEWMGRSPQDVEDQISYPLTVSLLGVPGVKTVRSLSMFGFSTVYVIFNDNVEFYWSRSRVLEKLNSLPSGTLPKGVQPALGPDATALGQVYWYTLEGLNEEGQPVGGWGLDELRSVQDWYVRYALLSANGISEVASIGGFVREYQIDVNPDAMQAHGVTLNEVFQAVRMSNIDVGARSIEVNQVEYLIRGLGFLKNVEDIEQTVLKSNEHVPLLIRDVAHVTLGSALRRGALDKEGAEAVGGVAVARYGDNPLAAIQHIKEKILEITPGLPEKILIDRSSISHSKLEQFAQDKGFQAFDGASLNREAWLHWYKTASPKERPDWMTYSKINIVPFYDRSGLIYETLGTLNSAISLQILITIIVVLVMVRHLTSSVLISGLLPIAVLMTFIAMRYTGVDANIVALSGIAIAIGTMVDMGIVICENILRKLDEHPDKSTRDVIHQATSEVGSAVMTAVATTVVSFLPIFAMEAAEGKLFKPLAYTKTFALLASLVVALILIPPVAHLLIRKKKKTPSRTRLFQHKISTWILVIAVGFLLAQNWLPLGAEKSLLSNILFVVLILATVLGFTFLFLKQYPRLLRWALWNKKKFLLLPGSVLLFGMMAWLGFNTFFGWLPQAIKTSPPISALAHKFPGLGKEFMPSLDEGSFLLMPTTMPHASMAEALDVLSKQDMALQAIPEIESVVGKLGRAESPLDPAPISMFETVINYKSEYIKNPNGRLIKFRYDRKTQDYIRSPEGQLIPDRKGRPFRQWRDNIQSTQDIWNQITKAVTLPGTTGAAPLQPIEARRIMLQTGMAGRMGVKIKGPDLATIEQVALQIESLLREVPSVNRNTVRADRMIGKPYLEIDIDRKAIARYGLHVRQVQDVIEVAIGGKQITTTVEGRERYPVRVRYMRELRDQIESLSDVLVATPDGAQIPLKQLAEIRYIRGPQVIKSEDTFLLGYVVFDKQANEAEVDVVEHCQKYLADKIATGKFIIPEGVSYSFTGSYENQIRAAKKLALLVPISLFIIFMILYLQFRSTMTALIVFSGIAVAWAGGFIMIWLYAQDSFLNLSLFGANLRDILHIQPLNLSVAVWVGFLALFGIASDDGVLMSTYLDQVFKRKTPHSIDAIRNATIEAAQRRIRPALMTSATTILALLPILTSTGKGSDIMIPMAIPSFGGMAVALLTVFVVPVLYCAQKESAFRRN